MHDDPSQETVALRPNSDQAHAKLSGVMHSLGDSDAAIAAMQRAATLNPSRTTMAALVKVLAPKGRLEEARVIWERMLADNPPDHDRWYGRRLVLAMAQFKSGSAKMRARHWRQRSQRTTGSNSSTIFPPSGPATFSPRGGSHDSAESGGIS